MKDPNCGCEINEVDTPKKEFLFNNNGVGEEIFEDNDLFDKVKEYYKNYTKPNKICEDLLLENIILKSNSNDFILINELLKIKNNDNISNNKNVINNDNISNNKNVINNDNISNNKNVINNDNISKEEPVFEKYVDINKLTKINYIKDYLKKLKDGS